MGGKRTLSNALHRRDCEGNFCISSLAKTASIPKSEGAPQNHPSRDTASSPSNEARTSPARTKERFGDTGFLATNFPVQRRFP
jgi:hypothetical protein